jgi:hypothetical protein
MIVKAKRIAIICSSVVGFRWSGKELVYAIRCSRVRKRGGEKNFPPLKFTRQRKRETTQEDSCSPSDCDNGGKRRAVNWYRPVAPNSHDADINIPTRRHVIWRHSTCYCIEHNTTCHRKDTEFTNPRFPRCSRRQVELRNWLPIVDEQIRYPTLIFTHGNT